MNKVTPVACTQVDWAAYADLSVEALGISPISILNGAAVSTESSSAFLSSLRLKNPKSTLFNGRFDGSLYNHAMYSFGVILDEYDTLIELQNRTNLDWIIHQTRKAYFCIVSGNVGQWHDAIINCCKECVLFETRLTANKFFLFFERAGYREIWINFRKKGLQDKTFTLDYTD